MRLKRVVFPAPLGPMRAAIVWRSTAKLARATARRPRNDLLTSSTSSNATSDPLGAEAQRARQRRPDAVRQIDRDDQQQQAVDDLLDAGNVEPQSVHDLRRPVAEQHQRAGPDDGTEEGPDAPH